MSEQRSRQLSVFLLRPDTVVPDNALRKPGALDRHAVNAKLAFDGVFYSRASRRRKPDWVSFVETGLGGRLPELRTSSASGVLFLRSSGRWIALAFGHGRFLLNPDSIESDFGLRVTLNAVDPDKLRSIDVKTFQELTVHTRRQTSRGSGLPTFGLDVSRDILRAVMGEPRDATLAKRLAGADAVTYVGPIDFAALPQLADRLLKEYEKTEYRDRFAWVDHLRIVTKPHQVERLNDRLVEALRDGNTERAHLAPPEALEWPRVSGFKYPADASGVVRPDLDIDEFLEVQGAGTIAIPTLKSRSIKAIASDNNDVHDQWPSYRCLVFETELDGKGYVLTGGQWFQIDLVFSKRVDTEVAALAGPLGFTLPTTTAAEAEEDYNRRAAAALGFALLDQDLVRTSTYPYGVEAADLAGPNLLVHVKRKTKSSTLSHLFAQGAVSGDLLVSDPAFRAELRTKLDGRIPALAAALVDPFKPSGLTIVFAVLARPKGSWPTSLPFFSRLHAYQTARMLAGRGFAVGLVRVDTL